MSKIFLAMRGTTAPPSNPKQKGAHPPSDTPLMCQFDGGPLRKSGHFFYNISEMKNSVLGLNRTFFSLFEASKGGGKKPSKHVYITEKVKRGCCSFLMVS
jgi:hypothetical protein